MILGVNPTALGAKKVPFLPWKAPWVLGVFDAARSTQTIVSSEATIIQSMRNPADTLVLASDGTVPATAGPTVGAVTISGHAAWGFDGSTMAMQNASIAIPAVDGSHPQFWYAVFRGNASGSGFNYAFCAGHGSGVVDPSVSLGFSGAGIIGRGNGSTNTVTTGYAQGTAKRMVSSFTGASADFLQWGAAKTTGAYGGQSARTGFTVGARGDLAGVTYTAMDLAVLVLCSGSPATGNRLALLDNFYSNEFTSWSGMVS